MAILAVLILNLVIHEKTDMVQHILTCRMGTIHEHQISNAFTNTA
jgi:hypothetical protein